VELSSARTRSSHGRAEPLSESRYKIEFTASAELRDKLQRAQDLLGHTPGAGRDLALIVESAVDLLIEKLERRRLGKVKRPARPRSASPARSRHVSRAVRRAVFERDGEQCTYVAADGHRCPARALLELDHIHPRALGGGDDAANLRIRCRSHNQRWAEQVYGREHMARQRNLRRQQFPAGPAGDGDERGSERRDVQPDRAATVQPLSRSGAEHDSTSGAPVLDEVRCALERLGFRPAEARQAIIAVRGMAGAGSDRSAFERLLRAALCHVRL
jgi:hypothetical protein